MSTLITGEAVAVDVRAASLAARAASCAIDVLVYSIVYVAVFISAAWLVQYVDGVNDLLVNSLMIILTILTLVAIPCAVEVLTRGRSVGKFALGLRIVREDGGAISFRHSILRALLYQFEVLSSGGGIAALTGLLSPQSKRLGDYLAGTIAVSERGKLPRMDPIVPSHRCVAWLTIADISPIPGPLFYRTVQFLSTARDRSAESRRQRAVELAFELNPYVAPAPPLGCEPEEFLAAIVARTRHDALQRARSSQESVDAFERKVGHLPHGLHL